MKQLCYVLLLLALSSCNHHGEKSDTDTAKTDGHPSWIMQGNVYEVNVRQYTPQGTFKAFAKHLVRLHEMGVQTLWFMPINPISRAERKGSLGSYYAVSDYTAINPEYGTMEDWKALVKQAHEMGFKVMIDWVPNHSGADHYWLQKHPDFYVKDDKGKPVSQFDWTDTRKLNFANAELRDTMIAQMKFWITETGIDGFRCDYAVGPSRAFWKDCLTQLHQAKQGLFMLAEADSAWLHEVGFDATYAWPEFHTTKKIAAGKTNALAIDSVLAFADSTLPANALRLYFTSNHDENSWNGADFSTMPGASHAPFAVLSQTIKRSIPLVYSGQEEPVLHAIKFFDKDPMEFREYKREMMYKMLNRLRMNNPALAANASFTKLKTGNDEHIYAFFRQAGTNVVVVLLNLSNDAQDFDLSAADRKQIDGKYYYMGDPKKSQLMTLPEHVSLKPWGYTVFVKD